MALGRARHLRTLNRTRAALGADVRLFGLHMLASRVFPNPLQSWRTTAFLIAAALVLLPLSGIPVAAVTPASEGPGSGGSGGGADDSGLVQQADLPSATPSPSPQPRSIRGVAHRFPDSLRFHRFAELPSDRTLCGTPLSGDFDGDGKNELLIVSEQRAITSVFDHQQIHRSVVGTIPAGEPLDLNTLQMGDVDRDGRDELIALTEQAKVWEIVELSAASVTRKPTQCSLESLRTGRLGDWNGDGHQQLGIMDYYGINLLTYPLDDPGCQSSTTPMVHRRHFPLIGGGRFDGSGRDVPVFRRHDGTQYQIGIPTTAPGDEVVWADFLELTQNGPAVVGDFTGDGRSDIVVYTRSKLHGWWIALSVGWTSVELPLQNLPIPGARGEPLISSLKDLDGDGADELLIQYPDCGLELYSFDRGDPLEGVRVYSDGIETVTGEDGTFLLKGSISRLKSDAPGFRILPDPLLVDPDPEHVHRLTAYSEAPDRASHAPVTLSGSSQGPYVCLGYTPGAESGKWGRVSGRCPRGYGVMEIDDSTARPNWKTNSYISVGCCRLPYDDVLLDEHVFVTGTCPPDFIATSAAALDARSRQFGFWCTKINTAKYSLTGDAPGIYWGAGLSMRGAATRIGRGQVPPAIRRMLGRVNLLRWDADGCMPREAGALLYGMRGLWCESARFKTLRYAASPASLPSVTFSPLPRNAPASGGEPAFPPAVKMFPDCSDPRDPYNPLEGCTPRRSDE